MVRCAPGEAFAATMPARIDGTVGGTVVVEIDSREPQQVLGSVMDLLCHWYPKALGGVGPSG